MLPLENTACGATAPEPGLVPVPWFVKTEHALVPPGLFFVDFFIEFTS